MDAVRNEYAEIGVENYYIKHGSDYRNPHESIIHKLLDIAEVKGYIERNVLDLCCGSGEVTEYLCGKYNVIGADPYTYVAYYNRVGKEPLNISFKDIVQGKLVGKYNTVICSFGMHLCEESMLPAVLLELSLVSNTLIIITPNKRPDCVKMGWFLLDEIIIDRVRMRVYKHNLGGCEL